MNLKVKEVSFVFLDLGFALSHPSYTSTKQGMYTSRLFFKRESEKDYFSYRSDFTQTTRNDGITKLCYITAIDKEGFS